MFQINSEKNMTSLYAQWLNLYFKNAGTNRRFMMEEFHEIISSTLETFYDT